MDSETFAGSDPPASPTTSGRGRVSAVGLTGEGEALECGGEGTVLPIRPLALVVALIPMVSAGPIERQHRASPADVVTALRDVEAQGQQSDPVVALERVLARMPDNWSWWMLLARVHARQGRMTEALAAQSHAIALADDDREAAEFATNFGVFLIEEGKGRVTADARSAFSEAIERSPAQYQAKYFIGLATLQDGDRGAALLYWQDLLVNSPADAHWRAVLQEQVALLNSQLSAPSDSAARPSTIESWVTGLAARLEFSAAGDPYGPQAKIEFDIVTNELAVSRATRRSGDGNGGGTAGESAQLRRPDVETVRAEVWQESDDDAPYWAYVCVGAITGVVALSVLAWRHSQAPLPRNEERSGDSAHAVDAPMAGALFGSTVSAAILTLGIAVACAGNPLGPLLIVLGPLYAFFGLMTFALIIAASTWWSQQMILTRNRYAAALLWTPAILGVGWVLLAPLSIEDCPDHMPVNNGLPVNHARALLCDRRIQLWAYTGVMTDEQAVLGWHRYLEEMDSRGRPVDEVALWRSRMRRLERLAARGPYASTPESKEAMQLFERITAKRDRLRETVERHPSLATENDETLLPELNRVDR